MTMTVQIKRKKKLISKQLQEAIDAIPSPDFEKLQPKVDRVFTIGRGEGLGDKEIGKLIRQKMKPHYSQQTIQNVFKEYPDAKQKQNHKKVTKSVTFDEDDKNEDEETGADKYAFYRDTIATKNKLLKEKDEEINGLKKQLAQANKRIVELETKLNKTNPNPKPKPNPKSNVPKMAMKKEKDAAWLRLVGYREKLRAEAEAESQKEGQETEK